MLWFQLNSPSKTSPLSKIRKTWNQCPLLVNVWLTNDLPNSHPWLENNIRRLFIFSDGLYTCPLPYPSSASIGNRSIWRPSQDCWTVEDGVCSAFIYTHIQLCFKYYFLVHIPSFNSHDCQCKLFFKRLTF